MGGALPKVIAQPRLENLPVLQFVFFCKGTVKKTFGTEAIFFIDFRRLTVLPRGGGVLLFKLSLNINVSLTVSKRGARAGICF